jgi:hypothetical protein
MCCKLKDFFVLDPISTCPLSTTVNQEDIEETTTLDMIMTTGISKFQSFSIIFVFFYTILFDKGN